MIRDPPKFQLLIRNAHGGSDARRDRPCTAAGEPNELPENRMNEDDDKVSKPETAGGTGRPTDESGRILFDISVRAHEFVKSKTTELTSTMKQPAPEPSVRSRARVPDSQERISPYVPVYPERLIPPAPNETKGLGAAYSKDYARIIHSPSFRRLQGKTQLIPTGENDFFRTRLTHSLEVAEVASRIAGRLNARLHEDHGDRYRIDPDLVVCASLLHDIGHPPFGHSGEEALNEKMETSGGFEGNAQTLRIVTKLENRLGRGNSLIEAYENGQRGLNLTIGTLASIIKYDFESTGPTRSKNGKLEVTKGYYPTEKETVQQIRKALKLEEPTRKLRTIECQIMDLADDIAYSAYDLEDTLEAGIVTPFDMMSINDDILKPITEDVNRQLEKRISGYQVEANKIVMVLANVFGTLVLDGDEANPYNFKNRNHRLVFVGRTYAESQQHAKNPLVRRQYLETLIEANIDAVDLKFDDQYPWLSTLEIAPERLLTIEAMKSFNFHTVILSRRLQLYHYRAKNIVGSLFDALKKDALAEDGGGKLLSEYQRHLLSRCRKDESKCMRLVADIISGFTDVEALRLYDQLHSSRNAPFMNYFR
jgi:dGTPase